MSESIRCGMGNAITLEDGMKAPLFSAEDSEGNVWNLSDVLAEGKRVVLYFYNNEYKNRCTKQESDIRENMVVLS